MYIELELLSDTCIGSGESIAGIIDIEVEFDDLGIPYIPSKRLKGILREAAEDYALIDGKYKDEVNKLFGSKGNNTIGNLVISNGVIDKYSKYRKFVKRGKNTKELESLFYEDNIKENFSYIRTQTAIDNTTGIAKNNSLRNIRVIKKGLIFKFEINKILGNELELLKGACAFAKHMGLNRTRGYGAIKLKVVENKEREVKAEKFQLSEAVRKVKYKITFKSSVVLEENYISGSTLLGLCAARYIKQNNVKQEEIKGDDKFSEIFLNNKVIFSNGYVSNNNTITYPTPITFLKEKSKKTDQFINIANKAQQLNKDERYISIPYEFGIINKKEFKGCNIKREVSYHHRRAENKTIGRATEGNGQYFSFNAIVNDTEFIGEISGDSNLIKEIITLFIEDNIIYLGASKSSQYGKAEIEFSKADDLEDDLEDDLISLLFTSPMIIRNNSGEISTSKEDLLVELGLTEEDIENVYLKTTEVGGFNTKWGLPKERSIAIKEGSVIVLKNKEASKILVQNSYGERIGEGFGRLSLINTQLSEETTITLKELKSEKRYDTIKVDDLKYEYTREQLYQLLKNNLGRKVASLIELNTDTKAFINFMCNKDISNSVVANIQTYLSLSNSFKQFDNQLELAKERLAKNKTKDNIYKVICDKYIQTNDKASERFDIIKANDFFNINDRKKISELYKESYGRGFIENCNQFELYKNYMNYILKIIKYKRRKKDEIDNKRGDN